MKHGIFRRSPENPMDPTSPIYAQFEKALKQQQVDANPFDPDSPVFQSAAAEIAKKSADTAKATDATVTPRPMR